MHSVNDPGVVWYGGVGHRMLSTDGGGVECFRCGMTAEGDAYQELIPDCAGPSDARAHHWTGIGGRNECAYGDAYSGPEGGGFGHYIPAECVGY